MQMFTGRQYLAIDIASNFGLKMGKKSWSTRLDWFEQNKDNLMELLPQAEDPALYYAGVQAWFDTLYGKPSGYPISLDATSSGLQLLAVLTGDRGAALLCNVLGQDGDKRADAYTLIYEAMLAILGEKGNIDHDDVKQAIMTALYGSQAVPKEVFGEGELLATFYAVLKQLAPAAWELNEAFIDIWDEDAYSNDWRLPDGFHVHVKVMTNCTETVNFLNEPYTIARKINAPSKKGRSLGANTVHSVDGMIVREMVRRCDYDPQMVVRVKEILQGICIGQPEPKDSDNKLALMLWQNYLDTGFLSARILDHINIDNVQLLNKGVIWELVNSLPKKPFHLQTIHDCFRCLPNYGNDLRWQYNNQLSLIAKSKLLTSLLSQIVNNDLDELAKLNPGMDYDIINADYALS